MSRNYAVSTISVQDVLDTYKNFNATEEGKETVLCFISELTGLSVDTLLEGDEV